METYIALLRGINVSGQKKINMNDLRSLLSAIGLENVRTYIQSGNVIFQHAPHQQRVLEIQIEQTIQRAYSFDVSVLIKTHAELTLTLERNPFVTDPDKDQARLYLTFLSEAPEQTKMDKLNETNYAPEVFIIKDKDLYFYCPNGYGNTKLNNNFFESKLKVRATTRNWRTVNELHKLSK